MADPIDWDWDKVKDLVTTMHTLDTQIDTITSYAKDHVLDTSGLIGALEPLATFFNDVKGVFDNAASHAHTAWGHLIDATETATNYQKRMDHEIGHTTRGGMPQ